MTSRYVYCLQVYGKIGRRVTLAERVRRWFRQRRNRQEEPDVFPIVGCFAPVFPGK